MTKEKQNKSSTTANVKTIQKWDEFKASVLTEQKLYLL